MDGLRSQELEATYSPVKYDETAATTATATSIATAPSPCSSSDMRIRHSQAPAATRCLWKSCSLTPLAIERNEEKGDGTTARSCWPSSHSRSTSFVSQWSPSSTSSHEGRATQGDRMKDFCSKVGRGRVTAAKIGPSRVRSCSPAPIVSLPERPERPPRGLIRHNGKLALSRLSSLASTTSSKDNSVEQPDGDAIDVDITPKLSRTSDPSNGHPTFPLRPIPPPDSPVRDPATSHFEHEDSGSLMKRGSSSKKDLMAGSGRAAAGAPPPARAKSVDWIWGDDDEDYDGDTGPSTAITAFSPSPATSFFMKPSALTLPISPNVGDLDFPGSSAPLSVQEHVRWCYFAGQKWGLSRASSSKGPRNFNQEEKEITEGASEASEKEDTSPNAALSPSSSGGSPPELLSDTCEVTTLPAERITRRSMTCDDDRGPEPRMARRVRLMHSTSSSSSGGISFRSIAHRQQALFFGRLRAEECKEETAERDPTPTASETRIDALRTFFGHASGDDSTGGDTGWWSSARAWFGLGRSASQPVLDRERQGRDRRLNFGKMFSSSPGLSLSEPPPQSMPSPQPLPPVHSSVESADSRGLFRDCGLLACVSDAQEDRCDGFLPCVQEADVLSPAPPRAENIASPIELELTAQAASLAPEEEPAVRDRSRSL